MWYTTCETKWNAWNNILLYSKISDLSFQRMFLFVLEFKSIDETRIECKNIHKYKHERKHSSAKRKKKSILYKEILSRVVDSLLYIKFSLFILAVTDFGTPCISGKYYGVEFRTAEIIYTNVAQYNLAFKVQPLSCLTNDLHTCFQKIFKITTYRI